MILDANLILTSATDIIDFKAAGMRNLNKLRTLSVVGGTGDVVVYGTDDDVTDSTASLTWTEVCTLPAPANFSLDGFAYRAMKVDFSAVSGTNVLAFVHANDCPVTKLEY